MSFALLLAALAADPIPLETRIEDVTVYAHTALVHRAGPVSGSGSYVLRGLPFTLDPATIRVRSDKGAIVSVEVRPRTQEAAPSERVEALRQRLEAARADLRVANDAAVVADGLAKHLGGLMEVQQSAQRDDVRNGRPSIEAWEASWTFAAKKLADVRAAVRDAQVQVAAKERVVQELERELGRLQAGGSVPVQDVLVSLEGDGASRLDVEYLVTGAGWRPLYELRCASNLAQVDLTYRAEVHQASGEDWEGVSLALSTAQPHRGAQGPEPEPVWLSLWKPEGRRGSVNAPASAKPEALGYAGDMAVDRKAVDKDADRAESFATVDAQGLSVRFQLPRRETVQSREQPTSVLVGQSQLAVDVERTCVPAIDPTVWMRGRTKNTSVWTLLPGPASVFLGQDFLGRAQVELVQPGQELTLHLGADPHVTVERTRTQDLEKGPGFLSSRSSKVEGWRIHLENHDAPSPLASGSVRVIVLEVLPRSSDERIEVELTAEEPKTWKDEKRQQDRDEKGILTWMVNVPRNGATDIVWESTVTYPKGERVLRR